MQIFSVNVTAGQKGLLVCIIFNAGVLSWIQSMLDSSEIVCFELVWTLRGILSRLQFHQLLWGLHLLHSVSQSKKKKNNIRRMSEEYWFFHERDSQTDMAGGWGVEEHFKTKVFKRRVESSKSHRNCPESSHSSDRLWKLGMGAGGILYLIELAFFFFFKAF